ncbi:AAA family ATPase [Amycolatopsis sp. GM8]|uniref:AAA family ATPase n=1 Tax=Amycolatopsis sp. GM8 TaxID=2896530 RepID=UPI001F461022|nr:LuxR family transcriptional regulator [Amycolatopsis sp. GM8]
MGRSSELDRIRELIGDPDCRGAVIAGPPGVGKTRLAVECLNLAAGEDYEVARATATGAQSQIPLAALSHLLSSTRLKSNLGAAPDQPEALLRARRAIASLAAGGRLVLMIDDAHLLDETSATVIYQLIAANEAFVLLTVRAEEPSPEVLVTAWKDDQITRIELAGLATEAVGELLGEVLGHVDPDAVEVFADHAEQNALVLRELVLGAVRDGALTCAEGMWRLRGELTPSARLIELIETRLRTLDDDDRALAEVIAVGEPLTLTELAALGDLRRAEKLERQGIVGCERVGAVVIARLAHPVYAEVLRARLPMLRVQAIADQLADSIGAPTEPAAMLRLGRLLLLSGRRDPERLLAAARTARWSYAIGLAEELVNASLQFERCFEAELFAAGLAGLRGRWQEADDQLARLMAEASDDGQRARVTIAAMDNCLYAGLPEKQLALAEAGRTEVADPVWRDEILARSSPVLVMSRGPEATWSAVEDLLYRASGATFVWASLTGAHAQGRRGGTQRALELTYRGHTAQLALAEPIAWYPWFHHYNRCEILLMTGRCAEAEALAQDEHRRAVRVHSAEAQASFASQLALILTAQGRVRTAAKYARESIAIFADLGRPMFHRQSAQRLAMALALGGEVAEAEEVLEQCADESDPAYLYNASDVLHTHAWVAAAGGRLAKARAWLDEMLALTENIGDRVGQSVALHSLVRLMDGQRTDELLARFEALGEHLDGEFYAARLLHVQGLHSGDPATLEKAAHEFASAGAFALAVEAAADAATRWEKHGEPRRRTAVSHLARNYLAQCEGITPTLRSISSRSALTAAERATAELAARGYSNRAIADELVLSVRSIENRLQRAYEKLAINRREELAEALKFEPT